MTDSGGKRPELPKKPAHRPPENSRLMAILLAVEWRHRVLGHGRATAQDWAADSWTEYGRSRVTAPQPLPNAPDGDEKQEKKNRIRPIQEAIRRVAIRLELRGIIVPTKEGCLYLSSPNPPDVPPPRGAQGWVWNLGWEVARPIQLIGVEGAPPL